MPPTLQDLGTDRLSIDERMALVHDRAKNELISKSAGLAYPIRGGVPIMLESEARELSEAERA